MSEIQTNKVTLNSNNSEPNLYVNSQSFLPNDNPNQIELKRKALIENIRKLHFQNQDLKRKAYKIGPIDHKTALPPVSDPYLHKD